MLFVYIIGLDLDRVISDTRLLFPNDPPSSTPESFRTSELSGHITSRQLDYILRLWKLTYDLLSLLGWKRDNNPPTYPARENTDDQTGKLIDLSKFSIIIIIFFLAIEMHLT
jgi:hypothetical protein